MNRSLVFVFCVCDCDCVFVVVFCEYEDKDNIDTTRVGEVVELLSECVFCLFIFLSFNSRVSVSGVTLEDESVPPVSSSSPLHSRMLNANHGRDKK